MQGWDEAAWVRRESALRRRARAAGSEEEAWRVIARDARGIMRSFTTGFFLASRFLPRGKRERVEVIYAAVRYPDEVADTFPIDAAGRRARLDRWSGQYLGASAAGSLREALELGASPWLAGFARVARETGIPPDEYRAFLDAMRRDVEPKPFRTFDELIEDYVYGSAIVVGLFLARVYGPRAPETMGDALHAARELGIALQLTNFLRDIGEDGRRGRLYIPLDILAEEGIPDPDPLDPAQEPGFLRAARRLAGEADKRYRDAGAALDAFSGDCRDAMRACIEVYRALNERIRTRARSLSRRERVPLREKWRVLPPSKYWKIPLAYAAR